MKNSVKKFAAIALCSLGALISSPLGFCSGTDKKHVTTKPVLPRVERIGLIAQDKIYHINNKHNILSKQYCQKSLELHGIIQAPFADSMVQEKAFLNQTKMQILHLPKIKTIDKCAFEGCTNFKALILTSSIEYIHPEAFKGCNPELIIICDSVHYTIPEFFTKMFEKIKKQCNPFQP